MQQDVRNIINYDDTLQHRPAYAVTRQFKLIDTAVYGGSVDNTTLESEAREHTLDSGACSCKNTHK